MANSKYSHDILSWSGPQPIDTDFANVSSSQALTSLIGASPGLYKYNSFPFACIYDVIVNVTASANGGGTNQVDVYNTLSAGSTANSYLTAPFTIPNSAGAATYSMRAQGLLKTPEIGFVAPGGDAWIKFCNTYVFALGQVFSVRAATGGGGTISNLSAVIQLVASDLPFLTF